MLLARVLMRDTFVPSVGSPDRYHIVAASDLRDAARKLETSQGQEREALEKSRSPEFGQKSGHSCTKTGKSSHTVCSRTPR